MEGEFVMVIYFMYSVSDHKSCIWNMILYSVPKVKEPLVTFPPPFSSPPEYHFRFAYQVNAVYIGEYRKQW